MRQSEQDVLIDIPRLHEEVRGFATCSVPTHLMGEARSAAARELVFVREEAEHGPRVARLHGGDPAARKRVQRALIELEAAGLVERWAPWGRNFTHVRLSAEGERVVAELLASTKVEVPTDAT